MLLPHDFNSRTLMYRKPAEHLMLKQNKVIKTTAKNDRAIRVRTGERERESERVGESEQRARLKKGSFFIKFHFLTSIWWSVVLRLCFSLSIVVAGAPAASINSNKQTIQRRRTRKKRTKIYLTVLSLKSIKRSLLCHVFQLGWNENWKFQVTKNTWGASIALKNGGAARDGTMFKILSIERRTNS